VVNTIEPDDIDPGAPHDALESVDGAAAANFGSDGRGDITGLELPGPLRRVDVDIAEAEAFLTACMTSRPRVGYKLGGKIKRGQTPGRDFVGVDCSGFVRETLRRSTNLGGSFPDGSVVQHDWVKAQGFQLTTIDAAKDASGIVRIAFLSPSDSPSGIGHVVLVHLGKTLESHGGVGPDSRPWTGGSWQGKARVYVLDPRSPGPGA
jgi:hypothetical protein